MVVADADTDAAEEVLVVVVVVAVGGSGLLNYPLALNLNKVFLLILF